MTRKDYERLAKAIAKGKFEALDNPLTDAADCERRVGISYVIGHIGLALEQDNPRFDRGRFEEAIDAAYLDLIESHPAPRRLAA